MNRLETISEEMLNALIDGELEASEAEQLYARIGEDEALANRVCVLRGMKDMMRLAYSHPPPESSAWQDPFRAQRGWSQAIAASLLLSAGVGVGWLFHATPSGSGFAQSTAVPEKMVRLAAAQSDANKILLHIDSGSQQKLAAVLDRAESLLADASKHNPNFQVEILANSQGLDLLRADRSPYVKRIANLTQNNENLRLIVCAQTLARLTREEGRIVLLPSTQVAPTAIGEVVDRLQQGWTYIKI